MEAEAGLSIKERLALLQANNKNPHLSGPMKTVSPVPPQKTATLSNKTSPPDQTSKANGSAFPEGKTAGAKPTADDTGDDKTASKPTFNNLRPTAGQAGGKGVTPLVPIKPPAGGTTPGSAPLVPKKPGENSPGVATVALRDTAGALKSPRPPSIQERMAALREKSGEGGGAEQKPNGGVPKSPNSLSPHNKVPPAVAPKSSAGPAPPVKPSDLVKSIHEAADRIRSGKKGGEVFLRHSDGKRFRKVDPAASPAAAAAEPAPAKPAPMDNVDLTTFLQAYAAAKESKLRTDAAKSKGDGTDVPDGEEVDEMYVEAESTSVPLRVRGKGSIKRATSVRISEIPEFTEEEEEQELYIDSKSAEAPPKIPEAPEEEYDDCSSAAATSAQNPPPPELEAPDEIYEPLDGELDALPEEPAPAPSPPEDKKAKKEKEKEKEGKGAKKKDKAKEEINKKGEKEKKKKEDDIKKQRTKFGLKDTDEKVGEGVVKNNASAGVFTKDLAVGKGEIITILRMDNNPSGKWLVQNDQGKLGFVNSNNIEMMTGTGAEEDGEPQELYEALPEEEMDEIYEEL